MKKTKTYYMTWTARNKNGELRKRAKRHIDRFGGKQILPAEMPSADVIAVFRKECEHTVNRSDYLYEIFTAKWEKIGEIS